MLVIDVAAARVMDANYAAAKFYGWTRDEMQGMPLARINTLPTEQLRRYLDDPTASPNFLFHVTHRVADGSLRQVNVHGARVILDGGPMIFTIIEDETAYVGTERKLQLSLAVSDMVAGANNLVARAKSRQELLDGICNLTLQQGGFVGAWITTRTAVESIRVESMPRTFPHDVQTYLTSPSTYHPQSPAQRAITTGVPVVINLTESRDVAGADLLAASIGAKIAAAVPFMEDGVWSGALNLVARDPEAFGPRTVDMLVRLAANLTFGLERLAYDVERARLTQELTEAEARYRRAVDGADEGIWDWDFVAGTAYYSPRWKQLLGYENDQFPNTVDAFYASVHASDVAIVKDALRRHTLAHEPLRVEFRMRNREGRYRWFSARGHAEFDATGTARQVAGSMTDITTRRETEGLLRLGLAALNAAPAGIVITDAGGTILWTNPAFADMTGFHADDAIGQTPGTLVKSGVQDAAFYEKFWSTLRSGQRWEGDIVNRRKDGSLYHEHLSVTPVKNDRGVTTNFVAIKLDLTHEREMQAQFLQSQKLETVGRDRKSTRLNSSHT